MENKAIYTRHVKSLVYIAFLFGNAGGNVGTVLVFVFVLLIENNDNRLKGF
jgi:hypothetical protein